MRIRIRKISVPTTGVRMKKYILLMTVLIFSVFSVIGSAGARIVKIGPDTSLDLVVNVSYGLGLRVSDRDDALVEDINADDANRNFDQWDLTNNKLTMLADIEFIHKNAGVFIRPKVFYDHVYMSDNANDSPETNNALAGGLIDSSDEWADEVEDIHGWDAEILDLFGYIDSRLFDRDFSFRVGKQVINWGESLLLGGMSTAQNPIDVSAAFAVGTLVKEILLPTGSAYLQMQITSALSLNGYYQWEWEKSRLFEGGTFFAPSDALDEIGAPLLNEIAPGVFFSIPRGRDDKAKDSGQYGIALMYVLPGATELGVYFINYHDKNPVLLIDTSPLAYYLTYTEDIKLYGASVSSAIGDVNVSGEFSYRQDVGFQSADALGTPMLEMGDYWQTQASIIYVTPLRFFAENFTITSEAACGKEVDREDNHFAWAFSTLAIFSWYQVLPATDTSLTLAYNGAFHDTNPLGTEGQQAASIGVSFVYDTDFKGGLTYENRFDRHYAKDRDTLALTLSYTF